MYTDSASWRLLCVYLQVEAERFPDYLSPRSVQHTGTSPDPFYSRCELSAPIGL